MINTSNIQGKGSIRSKPTVHLIDNRLAVLKGKRDKKSTREREYLQRLKDKLFNKESQ